MILKVLKIARAFRRVQFENFQNHEYLLFTNCTRTSCDFLFIVHSTKLRRFHGNLRTFAPIATAHLWCARYSLGTRVPCHVCKARAPSRNSTKYRAVDLCVDLVCEYICRMLGDPHFFFGRSLPFLILSIIPKNKKNLYVGSFNST